MRNFFNLHYILDGIEVVSEPNLTKWCMWMMNNDRNVRRTETSDTCGNSEQVMVSTVFLGLDHNYSLEGPPLVFETLVFGGPMDQYMKRYSTWEDAVTGHEEICQRIFSETGQLAIDIHQN